MLPVSYHYFTLSPLDEPWPYAVFCVHWLSSLACIFVSVYFFRKQRGAWWSLIALAFALPLISQTIFCLLHGLPPLPYGTAYPDQYSSPAPHGDTTGATVITKTVGVNVYLDDVTPLVAIALGWSYLADRKKRANGMPTAET